MSPMSKKAKKKTVPLNCEPCKICKTAISMRMDPETFKPSISGVSPVVDVHGINHETPHLRILYIDERFSVRSISVITTIAYPAKE